MYKKLTLSATAGLMAVALVTQMQTPVKADPFDDQIRAVQAEIDQYQASAAQLKDQANSLEKELAQLGIDKQVIQGEINLTQAQHDKLQDQITKTKSQIETNKTVLGTLVADMYVEQDISPLEMLASSNNVGDYLNKAATKEAISQGLSDKIDEIKTLSTELENQQVEIKKVLGQQELARQALLSKEAEQQSILNETRGQEAAYNTLTAEREKKKGELHRQQQAAIEAAMRRSNPGFTNAVIGDPSKGGYPWEAGCWLNENAWSFGGANGNGADPLGYGCRQCVSYTAYKAGARTGSYPRYWGNANMWPASARAAGYQTGSAPRANSVGIIMDGQYGHSVWVESVNGDGTLTISQYNYYNAGGPGWGNYSKMRVSAATYDVFIYF